MIINQTQRFYVLHLMLEVGVGEKTILNYLDLEAMQIIALIIDLLEVYIISST